MFINFLFLILVVTISSCNNNRELSNSNNSTSTTLQTLSKNSYNDQTIDESLFRFESVIHGIILEAIAYNSTQSNDSDIRHFKRSGGKNWLYFLDKTISPSNELISKIQNKVPSKVINNFNKHQSPLKLQKSYDIKAVVEPLESKDSINLDLKRLFETKLKEIPKMNALVSLSRVGFDKDSSNALVYAEFYSVEEGLKKAFFLVPFSLYTPPNQQNENIEVEMDRIEYFVVNN